VNGQANHSAMTQPLRDADIRAAARTQLLGRYISCPDTLVVEELGIRHGASRVDIAIIDSHIRAIEIKSASDNLTRLSSQMSYYNEFADRATIVSDVKFLDKIVKIVPDWCIISVGRGALSNVEFETIREDRQNPSINSFCLAHLLWKAEAVEILRNIGHTGEIKRLSRQKLYELLCQCLTISELNLTVRNALKSRENWRDRVSLLKYDDLSQPISTL
jgi:hypothetical protein